MLGFSGTEHFSAGGMRMGLLQPDNNSCSTSDDHNSDDGSSADSDELAEAEQLSKEQAGGSTAGIPAVRLQRQQCKRGSNHGGASKTGRIHSKRNKGSGSSSGAAVPAAVPAVQRNRRSRLQVVQQPEGGWRVGGMVSDC
jgi:hypothetical protein